MVCDNVSFLLFLKRYNSLFIYRFNVLVKDFALNYLNNNDCLYLAHKWVYYLIGLFHTYTSLSLSSPYSLYQGSPQQSDPHTWFFHMILRRIFHTYTTSRNHLNEGSHDLKDHNLIKVSHKHFTVVIRYTEFPFLHFMYKLFNSEDMESPHILYFPWKLSNAIPFYPRFIVLM